MTVDPEGEVLSAVFSVVLVLTAILDERWSLELFNSVDPSQ